MKYKHYAPHWGSRPITSVGIPERKSSKRFWDKLLDIFYG